MLGGGNGGGIQIDPNPQNNIEDSSQIPNDMDDEIPFKFLCKNLKRQKIIILN